MKQFWVQWQLWEKMCFCLATSIGVVIIAGLIKLSYDRWQLRKYTKLADEKRARFAQMRERQAAAGHLRAPVPFGVRAIESGVEVDGVWISRDVTPAASKPASLTSSVQSKGSGSSSPPSDGSEPAGTFTPQQLLTVPTEARHYVPKRGSTGKPTGPSVRAPTTARDTEVDAPKKSPPKARQATSQSVQAKKSKDRLVVAEQSIANRPSTSGHQSSSRSVPKAAKPSPKGISPDRSIGMASYTPRPEAQKEDHPSTSSSRSGSRKSRSRPPSLPPQGRYPNTSSDEEVLAMMPRGGIDARPFLEGRATELDWLNARNHAAETGQLGQRGPGSAQPPPAAITSPPAATFLPRHAIYADGSPMLTPPPTSFAGSSGDYFSRPLWTKRHASDVSSSQDPFATPADASASLASVIAGPDLEAGTYSHSREEASAIAESHGFEPTSRLHLNKAVRKVNSGFEILPAGSFTYPIEQHQQAEGEGQHEEKPRKLRKRSRSRRRSESRRSRGSGIFEDREDFTV